MTRNARPGAVRPHAAGQRDRALVVDALRGMLDGARRTPAPHLHARLACRDVEISDRSEHVPPVTGGEDEMVEFARRVE
ncbi:hypothetical protein [uncultured Sphingomonas sp.]|uniref:hypothetical protein n=1 Tax=uncultured Sphingomonas sp. TaxID=158754 RepID=UPI0035CA3BB7